MENAPAVERPRAGLLPFASVADRSVDARPALPIPRTPLIGRDKDIESIRELLLRTDVPLVTLIGPPGVGKSRLALAVAASLLDSFADGVIFVSLESIRDQELVLPTIAHSLGLSDMGSRPLLDKVLDHLLPRRTLMVLDGFEQLVEASPLISLLLTACPSFKVLVTSRVVLHLSTEHAVPVTPLQLLEDAEDSSFEELAGCPAVQLFVSRAQAVSPTFTLTPANASTVMAICIRLDGLPLAIELAAARVAALPLPALLSRLERTLSLLTGGARDRPDRLRTMRNAIAWSYDLLNEPEQILFSRLSVFVGGFQLDAVEEICHRLTERGRYWRAGMVDTSLDNTTVIEGIVSLVEKSLLRQVNISEGEPRFQMLETIREFGRERLDAGDEAEIIRSEHAAWVAGLVERSSKQIYLSAYADALTRLDAEHDNVRAALVCSESQGNAATGLRLVSAMAPYWAVRGYYREGRDWLERALAIGEATPLAERASALRAAGWIARLQGEDASAADMQDQALTVAGEVDDVVTTALALQELSLVRMYQGDFQLAVTTMEESFAVYEQAVQTVELGPQFLSLAYANLGQMLLANGDVERASECAGEALQRQIDLGFSWAIGDTLRIVGNVAFARGDNDQALAAYRESIIATRDHGDLRFLTNAITAIADVLAAQGKSEEAVRLYSATTIHREQIGSGVEMWQRTVHERGVSQVQSALSKEAFDAARQAGSMMALSEATAEALGDTVPSQDAALTAPGGANPAGLTPREREVLGLLASGLSDRDIASTLNISPRTVGGHVTNLLTKLNVESRTAAVSYAMRQGLI